MCLRKYLLLSALFFSLSLWKPEPVNSAILESVHGNLEIVEQAVIEYVEVLVAAPGVTAISVAGSSGAAPPAAVPQVAITPPDPFPAPVTPPGAFPAPVTPPGAFPAPVTPPGAFPAPVTPSDASSVAEPPSDASSVAVSPSSAPSVAASTSPEIESGQPMDISVPANRIDVCNIANNMKAALCIAIMEREEYRLAFRITLHPESTDWRCEAKVFLLKMFDQGELKRDFVPMFRCALVVEGLFMKSSPIYYVSACHLESAALLFRQEDEFSAIRPHKLVGRVDAAELVAKTSSFVQDFGGRTFEPAAFHSTAAYYGANWLSDVKYGDSGEPAIEAMETLAAITSPYTKFVLLFHVMNVCALRTTQKIHLCKQTVAAGNEIFASVDVSQYYESRCQKHKISSEQFPETRRYVLPCPPKFKYISDLVKGKRMPFYGKVFEPRQTFIKTHLTKDSVVTLKYFFGQVTPFHEVKFLNMELLARVKAVEQAMWYEKTSNLALAEDIPKATRLYNVAVPVILDRYQTETKVIEYNAIIGIKLAYSKYIRTINAQNICSLNFQQKLDRCAEFFQHQEIGYKIRPIEELENVSTAMACARTVVSLLVRETVTISGDVGSLSLIDCPIQESKVYDKVAISGSGIRYSRIAYARTKGYSEIYPIGMTLT